MKQAIKSHFAFLSEVLVAAVAGGIAALIFIPAAFCERGYPAVGGEYLIVLAVAVGTYIIRNK